MAGTVISSRQPVKISDLREAPLAALPRLISGRAEGSLVVTPIVSGTGPLGVIEAYSPRMNAFSDGHTTLLATLASAAGLALDNARLNASERLARLEVERLQSLTRQIGRSLSSGAVLDQVAAMAAELLESSVVGVYLLDSQGDWFNLVAGQGIDPSGPGHRLPKEGSLAGRAITSREPVNIGDVRTAAPTTLPRLISGQTLGSLIVAPVTSAERPLGVIEV